MLNPLTVEVLKSINTGRERPLIHKPVICLKDNKIIHYFYKMNLCEQHGFERSAVAKCCKHKIKSYRGFTFMYYDEYLQLISKQPL